MSKPAFAKVAVPVPLYGVFDYLIPSDMRSVVKRGCRVRVPFGRKQLQGIVVSLSETSDFDETKLKPISECLDEASIIDESVFSLLEWAATYYQFPLGEVLSGVLPKR
jgi:primosomal protein N' (replication factor Y)